MAAYCNYKLNCRNVLHSSDADPGSGRICIYLTDKKKNLDSDQKPCAFVHLILHYPSCIEKCFKRKMLLYHLHNKKRRIRIRTKNTCIRNQYHLSQVKSGVTILFKKILQRIKVKAQRTSAPVANLQDKKVKFLFDCSK